MLNKKLPTPRLLRQRIGMISEHLSDSETAPIHIGMVSEYLSDSDTVSELCRSDTVLLRHLSDTSPTTFTHSNIVPTSWERSVGQRRDPISICSKGYSARP